MTKQHVFEFCKHSEELRLEKTRFQHRKKELNETCRHLRNLLPLKPLCIDANTYLCVKKCTSKIQITKAMLVEALQGFTNIGNIVNEIDRKRTKEKLYANVQGNPPANVQPADDETRALVMQYLDAKESLSEFRKTEKVAYRPHVTALKELQEPVMLYMKSIGKETQPITLNKGALRKKVFLKVKTHRQRKHVSRFHLQQIFQLHYNPGDPVEENADRIFKNIQEHIVVEKEGVTLRSGFIKVTQ